MSGIAVLTTPPCCHVIVVVKIERCAYRTPVDATVRAWQNINMLKLLAKFLVSAQY